MATKLNENSEVALPLRNIISMIVVVAVATWGYFGIVERLNQIETNQKLMQNDVVKNTEFRIKWPRGEMGSLPADSEQFMLIEDLYKTVEKMEEHIEGMMNNKLEIGFLKEQMNKAKEDIEKLKDADREIVYKNGNGTH